MRRQSVLPLILLLSLPALLAVAQGTAPKALPVEPIKNFDIVAKGESIEHVFEIKNDGDALLEITDVRPACGCTVASFDREIAPGATGRIYAKLDTSDFAGPISKSIAVFTNDSANPKLQLAMKAKVKPYIGVSPGYARYIYVQGEVIQPIVQTLWAQDNSDIEIVEVNSPYDYLQVSYRPAVGEERSDKSTGQQWRIQVDLAKDAPVGALRKYVEVITSHPKQKQVKIPVSGFVRPRQHVTPMEADFGNLEGDTLPLRRTFHFTNFINSEIELTKVESSMKGVTAEVRASERDPGFRFKVILTIDPAIQKGAFETVLKIHTTDTANPVVELPLKGSVL
ncbi:MAG: DUF1573 domain-containing protein [Acidobacteriota bacterium]